MLEAQAPTIVLVHGMNVQLHTWDPIVEALRSDDNVIAIDLRGHGDSSWPLSGYRIRNFVNDIVAVLRAEDIHSCVYVGHSLGAQIGLALAAEFPELVEKLVLSDCGPEVPRSGAENVRRKVDQLAQKRGFRTEEEARDFFREMYPDWQPQFHDLHARYQVRRNWADALVFKADPDLFWLSTSFFSGTETPFLWDCARKVTSPTLLMRGESSHLLSKEIAELIIDQMPDARLVEFPCGHYIPREMPEEFVSVLTEFIKGR